MMNHVIILAGGSGTRLWPASSRKYPKQFLDAGDGKSFLQKTILRALALPFRGYILIVTHKDHSDQVIRQLSDLPSGRDRIRVLPEPEAKNTAPAIAFAVSWLLANGKGDTTALVMPSDHMIHPVSSFTDDIKKARTLAGEHFLVTFGIPPVRPETGYGYIEGGEPHGPGRLVASFKEKPDLLTAETFISAGNFFWNSGMFLFRLDTFMKELATHSPEVGQRFSGFNPGAIERVEQGISVVWEGAATEEVYSAVKSISVDYAVMEQSRRVAMVSTTFSWNDIGSWDEYSGLFPQEAGEDVFSAGSESNFVLSDIPVALCGVEDLVVVVKNGSLLICRKGDTQRVKDIVALLKERNREDLL